MLARKLLEAAGNAGGESLYVEDVFSTYLYTGDGTSDPFPIVNGIDLANNGGLVWQKQRSSPAQSNVLIDTERGGSSFLSSNATSAATSLDMIDSFNEDGFDFAFNTITNGSGNTYATWTFRKAPKFFDVVTYTGTGSAQNIAHNLGSVPACIIVKRTDASTNWAMYHTSLGNTKYMTINNYYGAAQTDSTFWNNTSPTDSQFTVGSGSTTNHSGGTYVAYIFASEDGGFGADGTENIIKCGTFNSGSSGFSVDLGFEPQWILIKDLAGNQYTAIYDTMRGWVTFDNPNGNRHLWPSVNSAEGGYVTAGIEATGFKWLQYANTDYIYIAIRRPMKTPESGTEVFESVAMTGTGSTRSIASSFATDTVWNKTKGTSGLVLFTWGFVDRLRGKKALDSTRTQAERVWTSATENLTEMTNTTVGFGTPTVTNMNYSGDTQINWLFRRAPGFFDVVCYTGTGTTTSYSHNLGVVPEFIIIKGRSFSVNWLTWHTDFPDNYMLLNSTIGNQPSGRTIFDSEDSSSFTLGSNFSANGSGQTFVAYLFATLAGVSKVGSYTGTAATINVDCGFSTGARFIIIKRTDTASGGDWYVWDSTRGIVTGNDPYLMLNSNNAEITNTDYIDPLSSGFTVTSSAPAGLNASGGSYIFYAIA